MTNRRPASAFLPEYLMKSDCVDFGKSLFFLHFFRYLISVCVCIHTLIELHGYKCIQKLQKQRHDSLIESIQSLFMYRHTYVLYVMRMKLQKKREKRLLQHFHHIHGHLLLADYILYMNVNDTTPKHFFFFFG